MSTKMEDSANKLYMRQKKMGKIARQIKARHYPESTFVDIAGVGGMWLCLPGEIFRPFRRVKGEVSRSQPKKAETLMEPEFKLKTEDSAIPQVAEAVKVHRIGSGQQRLKPTNETPLLERILERENLKRAYDRVVSNKGSGGVDGKGVEDLKAMLWDRWAETKEQLQAGTYQPAPIRRVLIDKPDGGKRKLGIPTVLDRLIQQAIAQQLSLVYNKGFSKWSYAYRPGRNAHQAIKQALRYCIWKSWKRIRTRIRNLRKLGIGMVESIRWGCTRKGGWRINTYQLVEPPCTRSVRTVV